MQKGDNETLGKFKDGGRNQSKIKNLRRESEWSEDKEPEFYSDT